MNEAQIKACYEAYDNEMERMAGEITDHQPNDEAIACSLKRDVSCVHCRHCGSHNGAQVRCKYPRERQPEVVDMTTMSGWTMASAAEICLKYEASNNQLTKRKEK